MAVLSMQPWHWIVGIGIACLTVVGISVTPAAIKKRVAGALVGLRWFWIGLLVIGLGWIFLFGLQYRWMPPDKFRPSALPEAFRPGYWRWMLVFVLGAL